MDSRETDKESSHGGSFPTPVRLMSHCACSKSVSICRSKCQTLKKLPKRRPGGTSWLKSSCARGSRVTEVEEVQVNKVSPVSSASNLVHQSGRTPGVVSLVQDRARVPRLRAGNTTLEQGSEEYQEIPAATPSTGNQTQLASAPSKKVARQSF